MTISDSGTFRPALADGLAEELAVLGAADHVGRRADQLDPERVEHAGLGELERRG